MQGEGVAGTDGCRVSRGSVVSGLRDGISSLCPLELEMTDNNA